MTSMITPTPSDPATAGSTPPAPWVAHFGFAKTPFTKRIAARDLMSRTAHAEVMRQAADLLAAEEHERHRRVVVCIDEAHLLSPEQLEELRLLTNTDMDAQSPFAGILVGVGEQAQLLQLFGGQQVGLVDADD